MKARKPQKPSTDFPLFAHASGKWAKKIRGKTCYFGHWADPAGALAEYQAFLAQAGDPAIFTVADGCNLYLAAQRARVQSRELAPRSYQAYQQCAERLCAALGRHFAIEGLRPQHFTMYRQQCARAWNLVTLGNEVGRVKAIFHWLAKHEHCAPVNFGPDFRRPPAKALRRHRREAGKKLFTAHDVNLLLDECGVHLRAMVYLGINCGFGNADCATLPQTAVDLDRAWIEYARPKTEVDRSCPLWPETVRAMKESLTRRYTPRVEAEGRYFVMPTGRVWDNQDTPISKQIRAALDRAGVTRGSFYWLRHTFQTVAGAVKDTVAVSHIMGHADQSIAAVYREEIGADRLWAVVNHVRHWLID